ncbi:MAG: thioredoxin [Bacteroidales bacterium]|nr:thioredoxin [Bacteroidales bacterium]
MANVITNTNFQELLAGDKPVLVDFWATWCGPCRILSPTVDEIAEEYADRITVAKCNVDDAEEVAMQYRIMSIPTLLFFKNGEVVDKRVGVVSKDEIVSIINSIA